MTEKLSTISVARLGLVEYHRAMQLQESLVNARVEDRLGDTMLLLRHPNVITLGRTGSRQYLRCSDSELAEAGYPVVEAGRGGEVTFHGPGQLIAYPIVKLTEEERDLHLHLRRLEQVGIEVCAHFGLDAHRVVGRTGVWLGSKKIAAIGVRARQWVTFHGLAFNLTDELEGFDKIVPCGITDAGVTCLQKETRKTIDWIELENSFVKEFERAFQRTAREIPETDLEKPLLDLV